MSDLFRLTYLDSRGAVLHVDVLDAERTVTALLARDAVLPAGVSADDAPGFLGAALLSVKPGAVDERLVGRPVAVVINGGRRVEVQWLDPADIAAAESLTRAVRGDLFADIPRGVGSPLSAEDRAIVAAEEARLDAVEAQSASGVDAEQAESRAGGLVQQPDRLTTAVLSTLQHWASEDDTTAYALRYAPASNPTEAAASLFIGTPASLVDQCLIRRDGSARTDIRVLSIGAAL